MQVYIIEKHGQLKTADTCVQFAQCSLHKAGQCTNLKTSGGVLLTPDPV